VPVGLAVDPTILRNGAIVILQAGEPNQRTKRGAGLARREQCRGAFDHITRPHEMIPAQIRITPCFLPTECSSKRRARPDTPYPRGEQNEPAQAIEVAAVPRLAAQIILSRRECALPLA